MEQGSVASGDSKRLSKERYTVFADGYVTSATHSKGAELEHLVAIAAPEPHWSVLDVATGGGHTALRFAPLVAQVIASYLTPRMLRKAEDFITEQGVSNVEFQEADAEALPFENDRFDLVTCRIAPHHFPDCARFVVEAARVLKPGRALLVQDHVLPADDVSARYVDDFERLRDPSHHHAFSEPEWRAMFEEAGLVVEHTEQLTKRHELLPWAERQGCSELTLVELRRRLVDAPSIAQAWMESEDIAGEDASFVNHHILIRGRKPGVSPTSS